MIVLIDYPYWAVNDTHYWLQLQASLEANGHIVILPTDNVKDIIDQVNITHYLPGYIGPEVTQHISLCEKKRIHCFDIKTGLSDIIDTLRSEDSS